VPAIDLSEETYVAASPAMVRARVATPEFLRGLWPDLRLRVSEDRGRKGQRFTVAGPLAGTAELWLEQWADGVIVHLYLRADPVGDAWSRRRLREERHRRRSVACPALWRVKDELEAGRRPGEPARR
jgi:hypothetical protein